MSLLDFLKYIKILFVFGMIYTLLLILINDKFCMILSANIIYNNIFYDTLL